MPAMSASQSRAADFDQRVEHGLQIERRAADHLEHVGGGGLLLQRFCADSLEQPRVLDGDHGLGGEVRDQLDLLVGERAHLLAVDDDGADQLVVLEHRHDEQRARAAEFGGGDAKRLALGVGLSALMSSMWTVCLVLDDAAQAGRRAAAGSARARRNSA